MNPDSPKPSRDEIEARLTALLLGELSAEEATLLNWMIGQDAELAKLHERLKLTVDLTREAVTAEKAEAAASPTEPLKLSAARREKLLAQFKTVKPFEFVPRKRRQVSTLVAVAAVLTLLALIAAMLMPSLASSKRMAHRVTATTDARVKDLEQLMHEEAIATGGPLPKDKVQSEKPDAHHDGEKVFSQNVVGYINVQVPPDSFQMLGSLTPSGDTLTVSKSPEDRRRELANSIVLPQAETDADQLGTMATANEAPSARPFEQLAANAPLKLAITADEGLGRSSESLREPAQSESQPQHFFKLGLPDSNGNEVANVRGSEVQVASVAHGANPAAGAGTSPNDFTSNIRSITATSATSALEQRRTKAATPQTVGGTTSTSFGTARGDRVSGNTFENKGVAVDASALSDARDRGSFTFGIGYSRRDPESSGNEQQGGQQAIAPAQIASSGIVTTTPVDESRFISSYAYLQTPSEISARGNKQDGFNLNAAEVNLGKPPGENPWASGYKAEMKWGSADDADVSRSQLTREAGDASVLKQGYVQLRTAATSGLDPNGWWSEDAKAQLKGYYDDNINNGSPEVGLNATYTGQNSALSSSATANSLEGTKVAGVVAGNGTTVDGTVSGPANQAGGIGGGRGGRGGASGGGGGGGGANAFANLYAGGGRGGRDRGASGAGGPGGAPAEVAAQNNNGQHGTATFSIDPNSHQLVVISGGGSDQQVSDVIKKLDVPARQTLVESETLDLQGGVPFTVPVQNGTVSQDKAPVLGDLSAVGRLFRSESAPLGNVSLPNLDSLTPAQREVVNRAIEQKGGPINQDDVRALGLDWYLSNNKASGNGAVASTPPPPPASGAPATLGIAQAMSDGLLTAGLRNNVASAQPQARPSSGGSASSAAWGSYDVATSAPVVYPNGTRLADLEGQVVNAGGTLALNGRDTFSDGPVVNNGTLNVAANNNLYSGATRDDAGGNRYLYRTDNMVLETGNGGSPAAANPEGTAIIQAATDGSLTSGSGVSINAPAVGTVTGVLTDPQFRVAVRALEQRKGELAQNDNRALGFDWYLGNELNQQGQGNVGVADGSVQKESSVGYNATYRAPNDNPPNNAGEEYRRNSPVLYYSFDSSFSNYFSPQAASEALKNAFDVAGNNNSPNTPNEAPTKTKVVRRELTVGADGYDIVLPQTELRITATNAMIAPEMAKALSLSRTAANKPTEPSDALKALMEKRAVESELAQSGKSSTQPAKDNKPINLNFQNAPLNVALKYMSEAAGFSIVQDTPVRGTVSITPDHPLTKVEAAAYLNTALSQNGYAAIRKGDVLTIVDKNDASTRNLPVSIWDGSPAGIPNKVEYVTKIVPIKYLDVGKLATSLSEFVSPKTIIVANDAANSIVITDTQENVARMSEAIKNLDRPALKVSNNAPIPQPEILASENNFSTFSLNVSDVSFKLAAASLEKGQLPDAASIRTEEFINAFNYRDPEPPAGMPVAFASERARYPFAHNRELLRFSMKTGAQGRQAGRPMNLVLLLDNSGSMERSDRVAIIQQALRVLASKLQPQDSISIITFARTPRLWVDGVAGDKARESLDQVGGITPEGGTNLEEAMKLAYETALRHYLANGANRVVLLTDGAANLGNVDPEALKQKVESFRKQGVALDCFGIGWEGFNDDLLEQLSSNGDGRYGFINSPEEAATGFAGQLAGALQVAAQDVKVQVEFNPKRVTSWRQIGYAKHQLTKQQFRDNTVDAAEIAAQEAGNALYTVETNPQGEGPVATVRVRFKIPGTTEYREQAWDVAYTGNAPALDQSSPAMRLAATASAFGEWLAQSPFAQEVTPDALLNYLRGVPEICGADARPKQLETMIREAKSLAGR